MSEIVLGDAAATEALGARLGAAIADAGLARLCVYLEGELGAGKSTLVRGLLRQLGHDGPVPSPTYTLVEPYALAGLNLLHVDLYRLADPGEAYFLDLPDPAREDAVLLVEWPERGAGQLPAADLVIRLGYAAPGRRAGLSAPTAAGAGLTARCTPSA